MSLISKSNFRRFINIVIFTVYALILIGGIVRSTGSGLGCPDWPTCFGKIVPPTSVEELPSDYKSVFAISGKEIADFDPIKTWTEYLNRLFGMLTGLFILILAILSFSYKKDDKRVFWLSQINLAAVIFQGWLGAVVVASNLKPFIITLHMVVAIVIVFFLLQTKNYLLESDGKLLERGNYLKIRNLLVLIIGLTMLQVVIGTQVREGIDHISKILNESSRELWVSKLGLSFYIHRSYSFVLLILHLLLSVKVLRLGIVKLKKYVVGLWVSMGLSIGSALCLAYFDFPRSMQPLHLLAATILMGVQYTLLCEVKLRSGKS